MTFDAFISYRRSDGARYAAALRRALLDFRFPPRFAGAPSRRLSIYLDTIYERATDDFFEKTIRPALQDSRHLIVVRTPDALQPRANGSANWVEREIDVFRTLPDGSNISVALARGEIGDPLPGDLDRHFTNIEIVDVRRILRPFSSRATDAVLAFVATLYDIPADRMPELRAEEARQRATRLRWLATAAALLSVLLFGLTLFALRSRDAALEAEKLAREQQQIALARSLAAESSLLRLQVGREIERAALLAIESFRRRPTLEGEQALRSVASLLVRRISSAAGDEHVDAWVMRRDGAVVVAVGFGQPIVFRETRGGRVTGTLPALRPEAIAFSADGRWFSAGFPAVAGIWPATVASRMTVPPGDGSGRVPGRGPSPAEVMAAMRADRAVRAACVAPGASALAVANDGRRIATARHRQVTVTDCASGRALHRLEHAETVSSMAFDDAGERLAVGTWANEAVVWNLRDGSLLARLPHDDFVDAVAFSPDGSLVATASQDRTVRVWETARWRERFRLTHDRAVTFVAFDPKGAAIVTASDDLTARVWDIRGGREIARMPQSATAVAAGFGDGDTVTTYNYGGEIERWDLASLADDGRSAQLGDTVFALAFRGDTDLLAAVDEKRLVTLDSRRLTIAAEQQNAFLLPVVMSDDGTTLASSTGDMLKEVRLQVVGFGDGVRRERPRCRAIPAVSARYVVCGETPRLTLLLDASTLQEVSRLATQTEITSAAFSPAATFSSLSRARPQLSGRCRASNGSRRCPPSTIPRPSPWEMERAG